MSAKFGLVLVHKGVMTNECGGLTLIIGVARGRNGRGKEGEEGVPPRKNDLVVQLMLYT